MYNSEKTIEKCLDSLLNQTYKNIEIICVNDGSEDLSGKILESYAEKDKRIKVINQENQGVSAARNAGIQNSSKEFIAFVDSDDIVDEKNYEKMLCAIVENVADCVCCDIIIKNFDGSTVHFATALKANYTYGEEEILEHIVKPLLGFSKKSTSCLCSLCNKLFRRVIVQQNMLRLNTKRSHGEDWQFCLEYYKNIKTICFIHEELYTYIHHTKDSLLNRYRENYFEIAVEDQKRFRVLYPELEWDNEEKEKELKTLPTRALVYYRRYLRGKELKEKAEKMYLICKENEELFPEILQCKNFQKFYSTIYIKSMPTVYLEKLKCSVKKVIRR